jgi:hypothetical protein
MCRSQDSAHAHAAWVQNATWNIKFVVVRQGVTVFLCLLAHTWSLSQRRKNVVLLVYREAGQYKSPPTTHHRHPPQTNEL